MGDANGITKVKDIGLEKLSLGNKTKRKCGKILSHHCQ